MLAKSVSPLLRCEQWLDEDFLEHTKLCWQLRFFSPLVHSPHHPVRGLS